MFLGRIQIKESERSSRRRRGKLAFKFGKPCGIARILGILRMKLRHVDISLLATI